MRRRGEVVEYLGKQYKVHYVNGYRVLHPINNGVVDQSKSFSEHRFVYEAAYGVDLDASVVIHHLNRDRSDNRPENLIALSRSDHAKLHAYEDREIPKSVRHSDKQENNTNPSDEELPTLVRYGDNVYRRCKHNGYYALYRVIDDKVDYSTEILEHRLVYEMANGVKLDSSTHVHHINHDKLDNRPENLRALSASEHMKQHAVDKGFNIYGICHCIDCGKKISYGAKRCLECSKKYNNEHNPSVLTANNITKESLAEMIETMNNTEIANKYGVSGSAVRKWRKKFGLPSATEQRRLAREQSE